MQTFGGLYPFPYADSDLISQIQSSYLDGLGSAYDREGDAAQVESFAFACEMAGLVALSDAAKNAYLPDATSQLEAWEKAFGLPSVGLSEGQRRINLGLAWLKISLPSTLGVILDRMNEIFGADLFASYDTTTASQSASDGTASIPGGGGALGGTVYPNGDWRSAAASVTINLNNLSSDSVSYKADLRTMIDTAYAFLDSIMPAWVQIEFTMGSFLLGTFPNLDFGELA